MSKYDLSKHDLTKIRDGRTLPAWRNSLDAPLFHEPTFLLREELREVAPYQAILFAVAAGESTVRAIAAATGLPDRNLHYYLNQLVDLRYVHRKPAAKKGAPSWYSLEDLYAMDAAG